MQNNIQENFGLNQNQNVQSALESKKISESTPQPYGKLIIDLMKKNI